MLPHPPLMCVLLLLLSCHCKVKMRRLLLLLKGLLDPCHAAAAVDISAISVTFMCFCYLCDLHVFLLSL
jgi:hypothetical protein